MPRARRSAGRACVVLLAVVSATYERVEESGEPRLRLSLNDGWRFAPEEIARAADPSYDHRAWTPVDLPHTWNVRDAFGEDAGYRRGPGWYRRTLRLDSELRGRRIFLYFEGANQVADVYVNGRHAGRHVGGYTAFACDVTHLVSFDEPNTLAVRVDNSHDPDIPPLNADFTFYGGLYRDVWLLATDPIHIDVLDHASPGVFIDTPEVAAEAATVRIRGAVVNETGRRSRVEIVHRILDPRGVEVSILRERLDVAPQGRAMFTQESGRIARPALWSPETPHLYRVVTEVWAGGRLTDRVENPLGFRWFEIDAQKGFALNGRPRILAGTNRHQDREGYGNALPDSLHREDLRIVKETGFDFLRLAHYPQDPAVLAAADSLGLLLWEEIPVVNIITLSQEFAENAERMLVEMIRQHYNHPSVLFWGYMNEVTLVKPRPIPEGYFERVRELAERLDARAHAEDPTRPTAQALSLDEIDSTGPQDAADVLGLNLYFGWYYHTLEALGPFLDSLHARHPDLPLLVSEYGAGSDERVHTLEPRAFDFSSEHQRRYHESQWAQMRARPYLLGHAVWNQFDFGSALRQDTKPRLNQKGLYFFDRTPKDVAYYYRAWLREDAVLHVATREWTRRAGSRPEDATRPVTVYTNEPEAELRLDGVSLGHRRVEGVRAEWQVTFRDGPNRLVATAGPIESGRPDEVVVHYEDRTSLFAGDGAGSAARIAVNAGAHYDFVDASGLVWEADRPYERGSWGWVRERRAEERRTHHAIRVTPDEPLYQATRESAVYRFDVTDGAYEVRLLFAEIQHDRQGARVFDAQVNGRTIFTGLDLAGEHGRYVPVERVARVDAISGRGIEIRLLARTGAPTISGIAIRRLSESSP